MDKSKEKEASSLLEELNELVQTLGIGIMDSILVRVRENFPSHLMGKGKMAEIIEKSKELNCDCIIFDNELSLISKGIGKMIPKFLSLIVKK